MPHASKLVPLQFVTTKSPWHDCLLNFFSFSEKNEKLCPLSRLWIDGLFLDTVHIKRLLQQQCYLYSTFFQYKENVVIEDGACSKTDTTSSQIGNHFFFLLLAFYRGENFYSEPFFLFILWYGNTWKQTVRMKGQFQHNMYRFLVNCLFVRAAVAF